ncbi:MAG: NTP transferase domain-containing protein [Clostridiales bacterium]|nr:NTP transferase domain-containing protein [Clostridiales bacterium]
MGGFKPMLDVGDKPALLRLLDTISSVVAIGTIAVVTGHKHELLEEAIRHYAETINEHRLHAIYNADYESGMFSSVKAGIRCIIGTMQEDCPSAQGDGSSTQGDGSSTQGDGSSARSRSASSYSGAALLFPADVPLVASGTIAGLINAWESRAATEEETGRPVVAPYTGQPATEEETGRPVVAPYTGQPATEENVGWPVVASEAEQSASREQTNRDSSKNAAPFAVPVFKGRNGHPLLIPYGRFEEILDFKGEGGLKAVRSRYDADMVRYVTGDEGCVQDMDTLKDYQVLLRYYEQQKRGYDSR